MSVSKTNNRRIAKNTLLLYVRMMFTMLVSIYTSRVILDVLGIEDYGLYQTVGGIVGFLAFINGALSAGSSRFMTFALGENNENKLKETFSTTFLIHLALAFVVVILAETIGSWFLYYKLQIAQERMDAAVYVFHLSVITAFLNLVQTPFSAVIIAREKMAIYAYVSIFEVSLKLLIVYLLLLGNLDKLVLYATLLCILQIGLIWFYLFYCRYKFHEVRFSVSCNPSVLRKLLGYSGWNLLGSISVALNDQGILILLNMFFNPAVVASRAVSLQVKMATVQFVNNFRTAVNPQIIKKYAAHDEAGSRKLLLSSTKYSFYLMLILGVPICLMADSILHIWLKEVPPYAVPFLQIAVMTSVFNVFNTSFYTAFAATGRMKENALSAPIMGILCFFIIYVLFKFGFDPLAMSWGQLIMTLSLSFIVKPYFMVRYAGYSWKEIMQVFEVCLWVFLLSLPVPAFAYYYVDVSTWQGVILQGAIIVSSVVLVIYFAGIDKPIRIKLLNFVKQKIYCLK
ncbi:MATE family efflux transporter [Phocaeicola sartorii]|mgnify:FL=1|uniref:MATE family efflux transporter n=1 Tax=Phocaeicola sartorii TaxID=671267 RepID=UPI00263B200F|nr:MATE family efflux transporter [Phocaeicola sartorii]